MSASPASVQPEESITQAAPSRPVPAASTPEAALVGTEPTAGPTAPATEERLVMAGPTAPATPGGPAWPATDTSGNRSIRVGLRRAADDIQGIPTPPPPPAFVGQASNLPHGRVVHCPRRSEAGRRGHENK